MSGPRPVVLSGPSGAGKSTLLKRLLQEHGSVFGFSVSQPGPRGRRGWGVGVQVSQADPRHLFLDTTRDPRPGEENGKGPRGSGLWPRLVPERPGAWAVGRPQIAVLADYYFVTREVMQRDIAAGDFIEHAEFSGNLYGTRKGDEKLGSGYVLVDALAGPTPSAGQWGRQEPRAWAAMVLRRPFEALGGCWAQAAPLSAAVRAVQAMNRICVLDVDLQGVRNIKKTDLRPIYIFVQPPSLDVLEQRLRQRNTETEESLAKRLAAARADLESSKEQGLFDLVIVNDNLDVAFRALEEALAEEIKKAQRTSRS
ncbi:hypothetical protein GH733_016515 [Mirounga leonina]|nr:hypothetical protein GH733_016515 [Mirounga leonina]